MISCEARLNPRAEVRVQASSVSPGENVLLSLKARSMSEQSEVNLIIVAERRSECDRSGDSDDESGRG